MSLTFDELLYSTLSANAGLAAVVADRLYPDTLPQGATLPALVYRLISGPRDAPFGTSTGPVEARVQFDAFAASAKDARSATNALVAALPTLAGAASGTLTIGGAWIENELVDFDADPQVHHRLLDVRILYDQ